MEKRIQAREAARAAALATLSGSVPYIGFLGARFERWGDELTAILPYQPMLIGNPALPALHGGAVGAFLEITAIMGLAWGRVWAILEEDGPAAEALARGELPPMPRTVDISIDYLRSGKPRDSYARAHIMREGRRVANVRVDMWQEERAKPIAAAHGHFLIAGAQAV